MMREKLLEILNAPLEWIVGLVFKMSSWWV